MFKKRILIVDLDPGVLDTLFHVLNDEGYRVHTFLVVVNLESQVSLLSPDLIFLDADIANQSGLEICKDLKSKKPKTPVVLFTTVENVNRAFLECEADGVILKPLQIDEIILTSKFYLTPRRFFGLF